MIVTAIVAVKIYIFNFISKTCKAISLLILRKITILFSSSYSSYGVFAIEYGPQNKTM